MGSAVARAIDASRLPVAAIGGAAQGSAECIAVGLALQIRWRWAVSGFAGTRSAVARTVNAPRLPIAAARAATPGDAESIAVGLASGVEAGIGVAGRVRILATSRSLVASTAGLVGVVTGARGRGRSGCAASRSLAARTIRFIPAGPGVGRWRIVDDPTCVRITGYMAGIADGDGVGRELVTGAGKRAKERGYRSKGPTTAISRSIYRARHRG